LAIAIVGGAALAASVWQQNWGDEKIFHRDKFVHRDATLSRGPSALSETGRYAVDVLRVIDGDTFEARVHVWPSFDLTTRVRLRSVDAPEMKARCSEERQGAEAARDALRMLLADRNITIWNVGPDKYYGRVDAEVSTEHTPDVSAALLSKGLVRGYAGGHRDGWCGARFTSG
jgi:endonuclease YncB( thermonuclease family)